MAFACGLSRTIRSTISCSVRACACDPERATRNVGGGHERNPVTGPHTNYLLKMGTKKDATTGLTGRGFRAGGNGAGRVVSTNDRPEGHSLFAVDDELR